MSSYQYSDKGKTKIQITCGGLTWAGCQSPTQPPSHSSDLSRKGGEN